MIRILRSFVPCLILALAVGEAAGQSIAGAVIDNESDEPIARATVILVDSNGRLLRASLSDAEGAFHLVAPQPGTYRLQASGPGYPVTFSSPMDIAADDTLNLDLRLSRKAVVLDPVTVRAGTRSARIRNREKFFQRRETEYGIFLDPEIIDRLRPMYISSAIRGIPGVEVIRGDLGAGNMVMMENAAGGICEPTYYVDGARIPIIEGESIDEYWAQGRSIRAIEVYREPTSAPIGFSAKTDCGVIVIWSDYGFAG